MSELYFRLKLSNASGDASIDFPATLLKREAIQMALHSAVFREDSDTTVELGFVADYPNQVQLGFPEPAATITKGADGHRYCAFGSEVLGFIMDWFQ